MLEESVCVYISQKSLLNAHKVLKDWSKKIKYIKLENLIMYFLLIKVLLKKKIQFERENLKLDD